MGRHVRTWVCVGLLLVAVALSAHDGVSIAGLVSATDQEADEGYFAFGQDTMIVVKPGSALHGWLRSHRGQRVKVTLEPDADSDESF